LKNENQRLKMLLDQLQKQVARQEHDLREAARFKQHFIARVSHDLRTPMTVIHESLSQLDDRLFGEINQEQRTFCRWLC